MTKYIFLLLFLLPLNLICQIRDRTPTINFNFEATQPRGDFSDFIEYPFFGLGINSTFPLGRRSPLGIGFNFNWGIMNTTRGTLNIGGFQQDVRFINHIYTYRPFLRFKPINSRFNPYFDGGFGIRRFLTRYTFNSGGSTIKERYGDQKFASVIGWAVGLEVYINKSIYIEARYEQSGGSEVVWDQVNRTRTDTRGIGLGLGFRL